jgi:hypothetical protein
MTHYLSFVKDSLGNNYLGIQIDKPQVEPFLNQLKELLSETDFAEYNKNQQNRDSGHYHITVINVIDFNRISKQIGYDKFLTNIEEIFKYPIDDLKILGVGTAQKNENRSYFVVCQSDKLESIRTRFDLPEHDFHITLGFKWKDVFGVRKNEVVQPKTKFLKELKSQFLRKENFNFIKTIRNFDLSQDVDIVPISISDNFLKISCQDWIMDIGYSDEKNELFIFTKYKKSTETARLPLTEIYRILENI